MNDIETAKIGMYDSVVSFLNENRDIVSGVRAFSWSLSKLRKITDEIRVKEKEASSVTLEKAIASSRCRDELVFSLVPVAAALNNYAREIDDLLLRQKTRYTQSTLMRMKDRELMDKASGLLAIAHNLLPLPDRYRISDSVLDDLKSRLDSFRYALDNKNLVFISTTVSSSFESLINDADRILSKNIDSYMESLEDVYPEFYEEYLTIRSLDYQDQKKMLMEIEEEE